MNDHGPFLLWKHSMVDVNMEFLNLHHICALRAQSLDRLASSLFPPDLKKPCPITPPPWSPQIWDIRDNVQLGIIYPDCYQRRRTVFRPAFDGDDTVGMELLTNYCYKKQVD